ncbi:MAG: GGDEF domain-containing protein [Phycisphaeraceae bacterium]|nr:GGDEF domain-containing protein [Phycisphaerales bacterium]MCB9860796.1 GGDEF domain-containing protein [Phycisphaeraceae bacterium]
MDTALLEEVLACPSLPSLPAVAARVLEMTQNPDVSLTELAQLIQNDQGLTAKILRTVNSSFYGLTTKCGSIQKALVLLGLSPVKSLVLGFSLVESVGKGEKGSIFDYQSHWRRGLYSGVAAKLLFEVGEIDGDRDEAFVAGLLQDIGSVALFRALPEKYSPLLKDAEGNHARLLKLELEQLEIQHPDVGSLLASRWKLPEELAMAVRYHERPSAAPVEWANLAKAVALGNIATEILTVENPAPATKRFYDRLQSWFRIEPARADVILTELQRTVKELASIFSISLGETTDPEVILEKARKQIAELATTEATKTDARVEFAGLVIGADRLDPLTGLMTKSAFESVIQHSHKTAIDNDECASLLLVHIDQYATIMKERGIDAADEVLVSTAAMLRRHFETFGGALCRWASDTFGVIVVGVPSNDVQATAKEFCKELSRASLHWKIAPSDDPIRATVSIGGVNMESDSFSIFKAPETLRIAALKAIHNSRTEGGNRVRFYSGKKAA